MRFGGAGPLFAPNQIAGLARWFDMSDPVATTGPLITDKSGNGNNGTQANPANYPTFSTINGRRCSRHVAGVGQWWGGSAMALTAAQMYLVAQMDSDAPGGVQTPWREGSSVVGLVLYTFSDGNVYDQWGSTTRRLTGNPPTSIAMPHLYGVVTTGTEWTNSFNGTQLFTDAVNTVGFNPFTLGAGAATNVAPTNFCDARLGEQLVYSRKLDAGENVAVKQYLAAKWGLTVA